MQVIIKRRAIRIEQVPNLAHIYDFTNPSNLTLSGSEISAISDRGLFNTALSQPTASARPLIVTNQLNGLSVANFNGTSHVLFNNNSTLGLSSFGLFVLANPSDNNNVNKDTFVRRLSSNGINWAVRYNSTEQFNLIAQNSSGTAFTGLVLSQGAGNWGLAFVGYNSGFYYRSINGNTVNSQSSSVVPRSDGTQRLTIGFNSGVANSFFGSIATIVALDGYPTNDEKQIIEGILLHKTGLQSLLPSNHPYRFFPPFV
jgi:hypothetical protein